MSSYVPLNTAAPTGVRIAQAIGITSGLFLLGQNATFSYAIVPVVLEAPTPLAVRQWAKGYGIGQVVGPTSALISTLALGYVTYTQTSNHPSFRLNLASTLLFPAIVPFTLLVILPTNKKLFEKKEQLGSASLEDKAIEAGVAEGESAKELIDKWGTLNAARALITGAASALALWAALDSAVA